MPVVRAPTMSIVAALAVLAVLTTAGCSARPGGADQTAGTHGSASGSAGYRDLPTSGIPDYQLGGGSTPPAGVTVVERDSTDRPAAGTYGICYVNGFQTQPDATAAWERDHPEALLRTTAGKPVSDPGWPDEVLLDTRSAGTRATIARVLGADVARCADRGFDAVEFDNLDSWTRSGGRLTRAGNTALAALLVETAHRAGLAAGQKNTPQLGSAGRTRIGFDFVVAEECVQYDECGAYTAAYGDRVLDVEYADTLERDWSAVCALPDRPRMTILRDRDLVPAGDPGHVFRHC
jgi:hypothetical protein